MRLRNKNDLLISNVSSMGWRISTDRSRNTIYLVRRAICYPLSIVLDVRIDDTDLFDMDVLVKKIVARIDFAKAHMRKNMSEPDRKKLEPIFDELEVVLDKCRAANKRVVISMQNSGYTILFSRTKDDHLASFRRALNEKHPNLCPKSFVYRGSDDSLDPEHVIAEFERYCAEFERDMEAIFSENPVRVTHEELEEYSNTNYRSLEKLRKHCAREFGTVSVSHG